MEKTAMRCGVEGLSLHPLLMLMDTSRQKRVLGLETYLQKEEVRKKNKAYE